jgi:3-hydroxyacyl-[acyl-carrier-protein] dehydratase
MSEPEKGGMDIAAIMEYLPHRYPMLLLDRVTEFVPRTLIRGIKNVTMNEPFFPGHFPGYPVMPGVLIIEALAQLSSILAWRTAGRKPGDGTLLFFAAIDKARFRRRVIPGDQLRLEADLIRQVRDVGKHSVRALVDGELVAEAELMAALRNPADEAKGS